MYNTVVKKTHFFLWAAVVIRHPRVGGEPQRFYWVPACAGMTVWEWLRGKDGVGVVALVSAFRAPKLGRQKMKDG